MDSHDAYVLLTLAVGIATVIGMIVALRLNAFISLITAAIVVSLMAPGDVAEKITRVAEALGKTTGSIGIIIAMAAVIGKCMMDSGAADRVVRMFLSMLGEKRGSTVMMASGYVLAVPVFFDTVFYLLVPLARSMYRRTGKDYLKYILAIGAGGAITHTLVPPTPGPLAMAANLKFDVGMMILIGALVAFPAAVVGLIFAGWAQKKWAIPMRPLTTGVAEPDPLPDEALPPLIESLLPIILPVLLISSNTIISTLAKAEGEAGGQWTDLSQWTALFGNPGFALLVSAAIAIITFVRMRKPSKETFGQSIEAALMSGGVIILITAAGGAFGAMLKAAEVGDTIKGLLEPEQGAQLAGFTLMFLGFGLAAMLKVAQGSSTVAMITCSAMLAAMIGPNDVLPFHPVYLATAIGGGSLIGSWMNDSGFWIFAKMGGLTEVEALKSWTVMLVFLGLTSMIVTCILAVVLPMPIAPAG